MDKWHDSDQRSPVITGQTGPLTETQLYFSAKWLIQTPFSRKAAADPTESPTMINESNYAERLGLPILAFLKAW